LRKELGESNSMHSEDDDDDFANSGKDGSGNESVAQRGLKRKRRARKTSNSTRKDPDDLAEEPVSHPATSRKARKNIRERARRREINDKHDELATVLHATRNYRVEMKLHIRDLVQLCRSIFSPQAGASVTDTLNTAAASATASALRLSQKLEPPSKRTLVKSKQSAAMVIANRTSVLSGAFRTAVGRCCRTDYSYVLVIARVCIHY